MENFINNSYSTFHSILIIEKALLEKGYKKINEKDIESIKNNNDLIKYFVIRNDQSLIAVNKGTKNYGKIIATHIDSPTFKLKQNCLLDGRLNVEPYGGPVLKTWFDRPLSIAGRIVLENLETKIVNYSSSLLIIPSNPPHLGVENTNNYQIELPLLGKKIDSIASLFNYDSILSHDLYLYNCDRYKETEDLIISPKLDDLSCVYASVKAFLNSDFSNDTNILAIFTNEEIGSNTYQGANSNFFNKVTPKLNDGFIISSDNAQAFNINHPELYDINNKSFLNKGIVIKNNANLRYATDAVTSSIFKRLCILNNIPFQEYSNKSDQKGGSTLGSILSYNTGLKTVDIGLAQLSMHSALETIGKDDLNNLIKVFINFYEIESGELLNEGI